jgi:hypothetical protein
MAAKTVGNEATMPAHYQSLVAVTNGVFARLCHALTLQLAARGKADLRFPSSYRTFYEILRLHLRGGAHVPRIADTIPQGLRRMTSALAESWLGTSRLR